MLPRTIEQAVGLRKPAAFFVGEFLAHRERYPSLQLEAKELPAECPQKMLPEQYVFSTVISGALGGKPLTFAEDCTLRQAIWEFALANTDWTAEQINLPNGGSILLNPDKDPEAAKARWASYRELAMPKAIQPAP